MVLDRLRRMPFVCILRGVRPDEAGDVARALAEAGMTVIEVTMNSPEPCRSIERMRAAVGPEVAIGAGTVLSAQAVDDAVAAGAQVVIAPNLDPAVLARAAHHAVAAIPGVLTPSEAFAARAHGATAVKLFPAEIAGPAGAAAMLAVWDEAVPLIPVGSIDLPEVRAYWARGVRHFGLGGALYRAGMAPADVRARAAAFVALAEQLRRAGAPLRAETSVA